MQHHFSLADKWIYAAGVPVFLVPTLTGGILFVQFDSLPTSQQFSVMSGRVFLG